MGKKRNPRCKECVNKYLRDLRQKNIQKNQEEQIIIEVPVLAKEGKYKETIQRTQTIILPGDVPKFINIVCSCGLHTDVEYKHSFDMKNDYYEGECKVCFKSFKLNIVNK